MFIVLGIIFCLMHVLYSISQGTTRGQPVPEFLTQMTHPIPQHHIYTVHGTLAFTSSVIKHTQKSNSTKRHSDHGAKKIFGDRIRCISQPNLRSCPLASTQIAPG